MQRLWKLQWFVNRTRTVGHQCLGKKKKAVSNFGQVANLEMVLSLLPQVHVHHWHSFEVGRSDNWSVCHCWFHSLPSNSSPPVAIFSARPWLCGSRTSKKGIFYCKLNDMWWDYFYFTAITACRCSRIHSLQLRKAPITTSLLFPRTTSALNQLMMGLQ